MKTILYLIQKEFKQIFRDPFLSRAIFAIPVIQMVVLVYAATFELKHVNLFIADQDSSPSSSKLIHRYSGNPFFHVNVEKAGIRDYERKLLQGYADVVMVIPPDFERNLHRQNSANIQLLVDAVNGSQAQLALSYCRSVIMSFHSSIAVEEWGIPRQDVAGIDVSARYWFNPQLDYKIFMAPGILVILVTVIGWLMTGMNIVKEKEGGTIEQLNVTPIQKYQFLTGKLVPFLIIGLVDLAFGLVLAWLLYQLPFEGSLITLFLFATIYLIAVLGIGLFISTVSNTQQQVLFISYFFLILFVLMSGLFTSVENMPRWGQVVNYFNPLAYFIKVIRMVLLKGSGLADISKEMISVAVFALVMNGLAIWRYRKTA